MTAFSAPALATYGVIFLVTTVPVWGRWLVSGALALVDGIRWLAVWLWVR